MKRNFHKLLLSAISVAFYVSSTSAFAEMTEHTTANLQLIGGLYFVNVSDLDFGEVTVKSLGENIYNKNPLTIALRDDRANTNSNWTISMKSSVTSDSDGQSYPLTNYTIDAKDAEITADGKPIAPTQYATSSYDYQEKKETNGYHEILTVKGGKEQLYKIVWQPGTVQIQLGYDLLVGDYTITTDWQITDSI